MRKHRVSAAACCAMLASPLGGCAAIGSQVFFLGDPAGFDGSPCGTLYCGTRADLRLAVDDELCCMVSSPVVRAMGIIDLPLSLAVDTALLPLTLGETVAIAMRRGKEDADED